MPTRDTPLLSWTFVLLVPVLGIFCGLGGAWFTVLLKATEELVYGFSTGSVAESAARADALSRFVVIAGAGFVIAPGWWALRKYGPAVPSVEKAAQGARVPWLWTIADTAVQVINVAAGASIGREAAPRQFSAIGADAGAQVFGLSARQRTVLIGCAGGAGLASIYNVPIGGVLFTIECVLGFSSLRQRNLDTAIVIVAAIAMSLLATVVAWLVVPNRPIYAVAGWGMELSLLAFAALCGPLFGVAGHAFGRAFDAVGRRAPKGNSILWLMPLAYVALALLATAFPLVSGNGHALALGVFSMEVPVTIAALMLVAKPLATFLTVGSGATGGKLTPSLSIGAAMGLTLATGWALLWPLSLPGAAVIGAAAMLAATLKAPFTAAVLIVEFTGAAPAGWLPVAIAIGGAWFASQGLQNLKPVRQRAEAPGRV